ncbi:OSJNBa0042P21.14 [Oryza sativa (japonica cultivar-group)]
MHCAEPCHGWLAAPFILHESNLSLSRRSPPSNLRKMSDVQQTMLTGLSRVRHVEQNHVRLDRGGNSSDIECSGPLTGIRSRFYKIEEGLKTQHDLKHIHPSSRCRSTLVLYPASWLPTVDIGNSIFGAHGPKENPTLNSRRGDSKGECAVRPQPYGDMLWTSSIH